MRTIVAGTLLATATGAALRGDVGRDHRELHERTSQTMVTMRDGKRGLLGSEGDVCALQLTTNILSVYFDGPPAMASRHICM